MSTTPSIASVQYSPGQLQVFWNTGGGTDFNLKVTDTTAGTSTTYPATGFTATLKLTLTPATDAWTVAVACTDGGSVGPYSATVPILTVSPTMTRLENLTAGVKATWTAPNGYSGSYAVTLQTKGQSSTSQTTSNLTYTFSLQQPLTGSTTTVSVQLKVVQGGIPSLGPSAVYTVVTAVPTLKSVDYSSGTSLSLAWTQPSGYSAFTAFLASSAGGTTEAQATGSGCTIPGPLTGATYTASVSATSADGVSVGPPSTAYQVISASPVMHSVVNNGAGVTLTWETTPGSAAYKAVLQVPDNPQATGSPTGTAYTFTGSLDTAGSTCWVSGTSGDGVSIGPPSTAYKVIVASPGWILAAYDAGELDLSWNAPSDAAADEVSGYLITLTGDTASTYPVQGATTSHIPVTLASSTVYTITLAATNGIVQGPPGPALVPLTAPPASPSLGYTGTALRLAWAASGQANVTGYSLELFANGAPTETTSSAASPQTFTTAFDAGVVFSARVRSSGPCTLGPWSAAATGPYRADITYLYDDLGRMQSVAWADGFTESYAFDSAGNLLTAAYTTTPGKE